MLLAFNLNYKGFNVVIMWCKTLSGRRGQIPRARNKKSQTGISRNIICNFVYYTFEYHTWICCRVTIWKTSCFFEKHLYPYLKKRQVKSNFTGVKEALKILLLRYKNEQVSLAQNPIRFSLEFSLLKQMWTKYEIPSLLLYLENNFVCQILSYFIYYTSSTFTLPLCKLGVDW